MGIDRTVNERVRRQRIKRKANGWEEVKVWVPKKEQAEQIRTMASKFREEAKEIKCLNYP